METPWWHPTKTDRTWCARLRKDYPDDANLSDESLRDKYADGCIYAITWDNLKDAYSNYEQLANAYLKLLKKQTP